MSNTISVRAILHRTQKVTSNTEKKVGILSGGAQHAGKAGGDSIAHMTVSRIRVHTAECDQFPLRVTTEKTAHMDDHQVQWVYHPPLGMCRCGCGLPTKQYIQTKRARGERRGFYAQFV